MYSVINQQPIFRTIGKRITPDGLAPSAQTISARQEMAQYKTRAPKGLYFYNSHDAMDADRLRWVVDLIQIKTSATAQSQATE